MKIKLLSVLATVLILCFSSIQTQAGHILGGDLTYVNIAPDMYVVQLRYFRDCSSILPSTQQILNYTADNCHTGGSITLQQGSVVAGDQWCAAVTNNSCLTSGTSHVAHNYQIITYTGVLTLPVSCSNWRLSKRIDYSGAENLAGSVRDMYLEASLNNSVGVGANSSPQFANVPLLLARVNQFYTHNYSVQDTDGGSLVYSIQPVLQDYNTPGLYSSGFTPNNPFGLHGAPDLTLDPESGKMAFGLSSISGTPILSDWLYAVVVQVEEYRKVQGQVVKLGQVRRQSGVIVVNHSMQFNPELRPILFNNNSYPYDTIIEVEAGQLVNLQIGTSDKDVQDQVSLQTNSTSVLDGATAIVTGGSRPVLNISWTPDTSHIRTYPYYFTVTANDNACNVKGLTTQSVALRVKQSLGVSSIKNKLITNSPLIPNLLTRGQQFSLAPELQGAHVQLYSTQGQLVKNMQEYHNDWVTSAMAAGVYFYSITDRNNNLVYTGKIVLIE